jgi:chloramphenicol O-acetyltransferase type A
MYTIFDVENWKRKSLFDLFKNYEDPFFNICAPLEVTPLYHYCRAHHLSFNLSLLYCSAKALNRIPELRLRIVGNEVRLYDTIHVGSTILLDDETFVFCYIEMCERLADFVAAGEASITALRNNPALEPHHDKPNLIYHSVLPWLSFTSIKHARSRTINSIPKIAFGQYTESGGHFTLPVSIELHHALADGFHAARYFREMTAVMEALG